MRLRILVIEDNATNMELMTYLLRAYGHATYHAVDGQDGVVVALQVVPDIILCDLALPRLDGYEVARRLKREPTMRGVPVIAVTASAMVGDRDRVIEAGFDGYITKPITPETFVGEVEAFLRVSARKS